MEWFPPFLPAFQTLNPVLFCVFYLDCSDLDDGTEEAFNVSNFYRNKILEELVILNKSL